MNGIEDIQTRSKGVAVCLGVIKSAFKGRPLNENQMLAGLMQPIWPDKSRKTIFDVIKPGESVCIVVSDQTRSTAVNLVLPVALHGLAERGCKLTDMFILVASGIHRHPTPAEMGKILGTEIARQFTGRIFNHNPDDASALIEVGTTKRGHRVRVNRRAIEADRLVLFGTASYHYHAGFGGGRKSLVPGLAARDTIAYNHSLTLDPDHDRVHPMVDIGALDKNPVSEEMLEAARMCDPDITINTVLAPGGELIGVFSGELDAAHRAACKLVEQVCRVDVEQRADFVIASAETAPNWVQSHKALFNAHRVIRKGGRIILIVPCPEGIGDERFRYWVKKPDLATIYKELRHSPEVLGQTALSTKTRGADAILVTGMSKADSDDLGIKTAPDLESAVKMVLREVSAGATKPTYYLMPEARHTVPFTSP